MPSVSSQSLPSPTSSDSRLEHQKKAEIETADGERSSDFNQESDLRAAWSERR